MPFYNKYTRFTSKLFQIFRYDIWEITTFLHINIANPINIASFFWRWQKVYIEKNIAFFPKHLKKYYCMCCIHTGLKYGLFMYFIYFKFDAEFSEKKDFFFLSLEYVLLKTRIVILWNTFTVWITCGLLTFTFK